VVSAPFLFLQLHPAHLVQAVQDALKEAFGDVDVHVGTHADFADMKAAPKVWVLSADSVDGDLVDVLQASAARWQEVGQLAPKVLVLFADGRDPRRTAVMERGAQVGVVVDERDIPPLMAAIRHVVDAIALREKTQATAQRFRVLVENSNDAIYILQNEQFAYVNPRFEELVNIPAEELLHPGFSVDNDIIAPESRAYINERVRRVEAGEEVESRYEFKSLRRGAEPFDAAVSISYIQFDGEDATLGILQDVTERKRFEARLIRMNEELALQNELAQSIAESARIDDTLAIGCKRLREVLDVKGVGICLSTRDGHFLHLRAQVGLGDDLASAMHLIPSDSAAMLAQVVRDGEVVVVDDVASDERVRIPAFRKSGFKTVTAIPMRAKRRVVGVVFIATAADKAPAAEQLPLLRSIATQLGNAVEKAQMTEKELDIIRRLKALDEIALTVASRLELSEVARTVARSVRRFFGPRRVVLSRFDDDSQRFMPLVMLDDDQVWENAPTLPASQTLLGTAKEMRRPVQRVHPESQNAEYVNQGDLPAMTTQLFTGGFGLVVAIPVMLTGNAVGGILLGYEADVPLQQAELEALSSLSTHVAIAMRNAALFEARNQALTDLQTTQEKLVQNEKLQALGELAAGVAHDFNNVLGAILGRAQLLKKHLHDEKLLKHAEVIERAAVDGAETVRRIQEIGRQDATDDFVHAPVRQLLDDVYDITLPKWKERPAHEGRPIDMHVDDEMTPGAQLIGNPHELREVLINLVHNAVDAMPEGGRITLGARRAGRFVELRVQDTGKGIPDDVRARIFDPFFTTKGSAGTGLGLSVSYSIMQRHKGEIEVSSRTVDDVQEGGATGTTFTLRVPMVSGDSDGATVEAGELGSRDLPGDMARVLVIDDEENIREILTDIITTGGHEVFVAETGPDGLSLLDDHRFDLVFTDLSLPGMSGYEVAEAVKARFPTLKVGLVTGWGATLDEEKVKEHGVDMVLTKPFRFDDVMKMVDGVLGET